MKFSSSLVRSLMIKVNRIKFMQYQDNSYFSWRMSKIGRNFSVCGYKKS